MPGVDVQQLLIKAIKSTIKIEVMLKRGKSLL